MTTQSRAQRYVEAMRRYQLERVAYEVRAEEMRKQLKSALRPSEPELLLTSDGAGGKVFASLCIFDGDQIGLALNDHCRGTTIALRPEEVASLLAWWAGIHEQKDDPEDTP